MVVGRPRKFDHDEARRLYADGWAKSQLARHFGVSFPSVSRVVDPVQRARMAAAGNALLAAECEDCGAFVRKNWYSAHGRLDRVVCRACADNRRREDELMKRLDADGLIHCACCDEYRAIGDYRIRPSGYPAPGCRACETAKRKAYRHAHLEEDRAWQRDYKRKRSAERRAA